MNLIDITFPTPAENLACDEALLDLAESGLGGEILRFWEPKSHFVVLGYSKPAEAEADLAYCRPAGIPVLRRASGGGTVLQGPGCLNYALVLNIARAGSAITETNAFVMKKNRAALAALLNREVLVEGHTDLAVGGLKFSGNAQRRKRKFLLFHGTILHRFDLSLIAKTLREPALQPAYRRLRPHEAFVTNIDARSADIKQALTAAWQAENGKPPLPVREIEALVRERYLNNEWIFKF